MQQLLKQAIFKKLKQIAQNSCLEKNSAAFKRRIARIVPGYRSSSHRNLMRNQTALNTKKRVTETEMTRDDFNKLRENEKLKQKIRNFNPQLKSPKLSMDPEIPEYIRNEKLKELAEKRNQAYSLGRRKSTLMRMRQSRNPRTKGRIVNRYSR